MEKGIQKGIEKGMEQASHDIALKLLQQGMPVSSVAEACGLPETLVRQWSETP